MNSLIFPKTGIDFCGYETIRAATNSYLGFEVQFFAPKEGDSAKSTFRANFKVLDRWLNSRPYVQHLVIHPPLANFELSLFR